MRQQENLIKEVRALFEKRIIVEVENKSDVMRLDTPRIKMSALTGEGVDELVAHLSKLLPKRHGGKPAWAAEEE